MRVLKYALAASLIAASSSAVAQQLSIATGGTGGTYYPYGGGIAELGERREFDALGRPSRHQLTRELHS